MFFEQVENALSQVRSIISLLQILYLFLVRTNPFIHDQNSFKCLSFVPRIQELLVETYLMYFAYSF